MQTITTQQLANQLDVENYELGDSKIIIQYGFIGDTENKERVIKRVDFEQFVTDASKLEYCDDMAGVSNEHVQIAGTMSIDEYWDNTSFSDKLQDLKEYLLLNLKTV